MITKVVIPTFDNDVIWMLRELDPPQPAILFGETPEKRRKRLKVLLADYAARGIAVPSIPDQIDDYELISSQVGDIRPLTSVTYSKGYLAIGSLEGTVKVWSTEDCVLKVYKGHETRISDLKFIPNADFSFYEGLDKAMQESEAAGVEYDLANSGSGSTVTFASTSLEEEIKLWNASNGAEPVSVLRGHQDRISQLDFYPTSKYLVSGSRDKTWKFWDLETQKCIFTQDGHYQGITSTGLHPDGSLVFSGDFGGVGRLWDLRSGRSVVPLRSHVHGILTAAFHDNGYILATGSLDNTIKVWDLRKKSLFYTIPAHYKAVTKIRYSKDCEFLLSSSLDKHMKAWNSKTCEYLSTFVGHDDLIMGFDFGEENSRGLQDIISVGFSKSWKKWGYS